MPKTKQPNLQSSIRYKSLKSSTVATAQHSSSAIAFSLNSSLPCSYLKLQARAEALGGFFQLLVRLAAIEHIYKDYILLLKQTMIDMRLSLNMTAAEAAAVLGISAEKINLAETPDKCFLVSDYLDWIETYRDCCSKTSGPQS